MDELTLLRDTRSDIRPPSEAALAVGRAALLERAAEEFPTTSRPTAEQSPRRGRLALRRAMLGGIGAAGALALGATLVLTNVVGLAGWRGGADPAAAAVLHEASEAAITSVDPVLQPGQYLKVETLAVRWTWHVVADDTPGVAFLESSTDALYVPADRDDDWVWLRSLARPSQTFGPESERIAQQAWERRVAEHGADHVERLRAPGGAFYGHGALVSEEELAELPRDPSQLLDHIYRVTAGMGSSPDGEALVYIADRLRSGVVPADLRAALYDAAALIPGVTIAEDEATLDGRIGVAIGRVEANSDLRHRQDIIVDPATGEFVGERTVSLTDQWGMPAGTVIEWTAVTTTVADAAPEGGTPYGDIDPTGCADPARGC